MVGNVHASRLSVETAKGSHPEDSCLLASKIESLVCQRLADQRLGFPKNELVVISMGRHEHLAVRIRFLF